MTTHRRVAWFSCGAASAVAAKLTADTYGDDCAIVSCDTRSSEHPDNYRFAAEVEAWIGRPIEFIKSDRYSTVDDVIERRRYMAGVAGALCTVELKKMPREAWQRPDDVHVFGYTVEESRRANIFEDNNPSLSVEWVLIDRGVTKADCHAIIAKAGIAQPAMYRLGYDHNNCPGCVKSQSPGYWNQIRRDFPDVFDRRVRQSRLLGVRLVKIRLPSDPPAKRLPSGDLEGTPRHFLDELPPDAGGAHDDIDCGPVCQLPLDFGPGFSAAGAP